MEVAEWTGAGQGCCTHNPSTHFLYKLAYNNSDDNIWTDPSLISDQYEVYVE